MAMRLEKNLPKNDAIGEAWEISAHPGTISIVAQGPLKGTALPELVDCYGTALIGTRSRTDTFPLLYKFIDASQNLSVQVHPNDTQARQFGWGKRGKTECWYIVHAEEGAQIMAGFTPGTTRGTITQALADHSLADHLHSFPVQAGDVIFIPGGTVHAILRGVLLYELQESSDTTMRFYDWDRNDPSRPLQVEESLKIVSFNEAPPRAQKGLTVTLAGTPALIRAACRYFVLCEYTAAQVRTCRLPRPDSFMVVSVIAGNASLRLAHGTYTCPQGTTALLPACETECELTLGPDCRALTSWVPDLREEVVGPLRAAGHAPAAISSIGGADLRDA